MKNKFLGCLIVAFASITSLQALSQDNEHLGAYIQQGEQAGIGGTGRIPPYTSIGGSGRTPPVEVGGTGNRPPAEVGGTGNRPPVANNI